MVPFALSELVWGRYPSPISMIMLGVWVVVLGAVAYRADEGKRFRWF
ncbi:MAG: hypothetical protein M3548_15380 [Actinomycetota bacterium]|nr:hypothetical protein [Actinomycetota bacterium]